MELLLGLMVVMVLLLIRLLALNRWPIFDLNLRRSVSEHWHSIFLADWWRNIWWRWWITVNCWCAVNGNRLLLLLWRWSVGVEGRFTPFDFRIAFGIHYGH